MSAPSPLVLLVEDNPDDAFLLQRAFRKGGFNAEIQVIKDGEAAIAYLRGDGVHADRTRSPLPALVLLDLKLPRKDGFEVLAWLRARPGLGRLPVVVLTSSREQADVDRAYALGANAYFVKPGAFDALQELVGTLVRHWLVLCERPEVSGPTEPRP